jgi:hypothetical protein
MEILDIGKTPRMSKSRAGKTAAAALSHLAKTLCLLTETAGPVFVTANDTRD